MAEAAEKLEERSFEVVCDTSDEAAWLEARKTGIGASEVPVILGIDPWRSPLQLFAEKSGALPAADLSDNEAVQWGRRLESIVGEVYSERTGRPYRRHGKLLRSTRYPWALATLDGETAENDNPNTRLFWPLEIKTTSAYMAEDWANGPPEHYLAQIHQQMLVTNASKATIACLLGGQRLVWCDVDRDETLIRKIVYHGERFWERVLKREAPDPDGSESARRVLHALFPHDDGSALELPMALAEVVDEWQSLKREKASLEKRITACENTIKATLGDASRGYFPGGDAVSWKEQSMPERVLPATSFRVLRYHVAKKR